LTVPAHSQERKIMSKRYAAWATLSVVAAFAATAWVYGLLPGVVPTRWNAAGMAIACVLPGNVLGKVRRNFWLGVRTPWTLADERVWYATHRLAARTMVGGGLLALVMTLGGLPEFWTVVVLMLAGMLPAAWSLV
jgi:uncharacterized membrane protein